MTIRTPICDTLGIDHPIILGGMMGISDARLTAAVSNGGALGTLSSATFGVDGTRDELTKLAENTNRPYSVNLPLFHPMVPNLLDLLPEYGVKIVTTSAGNPAKYIKELKEMGIYVIHVVSSVRTALKARDAGVDAIVAEGSESGGKVALDEVPTISLLPLVVEQVDIPVIAAGGFATGRGLLAALAMGAEGVQMGTRFLASEESRAHPNWKQVLVDAGDSATGIALRNSSPTRMVRNQFFAEMDALDEPGKKAMDFMPIMGEGSSRIPDDLDGSQGNYTAGTGCGLIREVKPAASIVEDIIAEAEQCMNSLRAAFD
ncbi:MAG: nitronate monooxygenase [Pseudomonadales bacterium]|jgi:enoyl-[acyl-carrier protein] reductase II|nr:nitronate monooxygenase [Pseudomonadales bacterium]MDP7596762.1 nitronate monooxygenase [Pseudomonadales bacterium]HJN51618.1 nitronate monooxygenase [Pseudomonadales bacterium]|tara:strand:- start:1367 stop:2317 length:951 start_codon:yes stop_codon:yes gene_type:complete